MAVNLRKLELDKEMSPAHTGKDALDTTWYMDEILYPEDSIQRSHGTGLETYAPVMRDDQVKASLAQRISRVTAREWYVEPGGGAHRDKAAADFLERSLEEIDFDQATKLMLYGIFHGYSVAEIIWRRDGETIALGAIKVRDRARFMFGRDGALRLKTSESLKGMAMPERKFWVYSAGADHGDNPYGLGLAHWLYWPVYFKRGGMKSWVRFLDKYGAPTAKGVYPRGTSEADKKKLLEALNAISTDAGVIVPEGMQVELIEAARSGQAEYAALYDRMNQAIAKVIMGQTMTMESGSSYSQAKVHKDVAGEVAKDDADSLCQTFNDSVARWLTEFNFPGAKPPKVWRRMTSEPGPNEIAELDKRIMELGYRPTAERIASVYGEGYEPVKG